MHLLPTVGTSHPQAVVSQEPAAGITPAALRDRMAIPGARPLDPDLRWQVPAVQEMRLDQVIPVRGRSLGVVTDTAIPPRWLRASARTRVIPGDRDLAAVPRANRARMSCGDRGDPTFLAPQRTDRRCRLVPAQRALALRSHCPPAHREWAFLVYPALVPVLPAWGKRAPALRERWQRAEPVLPGTVWWGRIQRVCREPVEPVRASLVCRCLREYLLMADTPSPAATARMARLQEIAPAVPTHQRQAGSPPGNQEARDPAGFRRVPPVDHLPAPPEQPGSAAARVGSPAGRRAPMFQGNRG
jgi:hypothetical protein